MPRAIHYHCTGKNYVSGIRTYEYIVQEGSDNYRYDEYTATTTARIREVVVRLFLHHFGCAPETSWGTDGFMAQAWQDRPNRAVEVYQVNHRRPFGRPIPPDLALAPRHLIPATQ